MDEIVSIDSVSLQPRASDSMWEVVSVAVRGSSHERTGLPCQDANAHQFIGQDWVALAVADGAGSAALSDAGARAAVDCAVDVLAGHVRRYVANENPASSETGWRTVMEDVLQASRGAVENEAESRGAPVAQLACTLLVVLLGPQLTVAAQIGDGGTVARREDGTIDGLTLPNSECLDETTFLTSRNAIKESQFAFRSAPVAAVACLTDGLQMLAFNYPEWSPHVPFFRPLFDFLEAQQDPEVARVGLERLMLSSRVRSRTDDDITLVVTGRKPAALRQSAEASL